MMEQGKGKVGTIILVTIIIILLMVICGLAVYIGMGNSLKLKELESTLSNSEIKINNNGISIGSTNKTVQNNVNSEKSNNETTNTINQNSSNTAISNQINTVEKQEEKNSRTSPSYTVSEITKKEEKYDIKLPKLIGTTNGIKTINEKINKIYEKCLDITDYPAIWSSYTTTISKYKGKSILDLDIWVGKGNSVDIIDANGNNAKETFPAGFMHYIYHYNIDTGEEYTLSDLIKDEGYSIDDINTNFHEYLMKSAKDWGGTIAVRGWAHKFVTPNDMYFVLEDEGKTYLHLTTRNEDGYIIENEKEYPIDFVYKEINYSKMN